MGPSRLTNPRIDGGPVADVGPVQAQAPAAKSTNDSGVLDTPHLPPATVATVSSTAPSPPSSLIGRFKPAVAGVMMAATLGMAGCAAHAQGVPVGDLAQELSPPAIEMVAPAPPPAQNIGAFTEAMRVLETKHAALEITADQLAHARGVLYRHYVLGDVTAHVPLDDRGRVSIDGLLRRDPANATADRTRGEIVMEQLTRDLEVRMRVTARDMARGNFTPIEGMPGYKQIEGDEVRRLLKSAFERIPVGELPGGATLTRLIEQLPGTEDVDVAGMTYEELRRELRDDAKTWLDDRYGAFIDDHKIELGVLGFAAVTGLRAASPEAAGLMDDLGLRVQVWKESSDDGGLYTRGRLVWQDQHIFPDLDIEGRASTMVGDTTLRAQLRGTLSGEADDLFTATATVGAHYQAQDYWLDAAGHYDLQTERWRTTLSTGYSPDGTFRATSTLGATFGDGVAIGDASGRANWEIDLTKDLEFSRGITGSWGVYTGVSMDTDGDNRDVGVGLVFRAQW